MPSTGASPVTIYWEISNENTEKRSSVSTQYVLDAWALLAMLQGKEPAASRVRELLRAGERQEAALLLSIINLGEVYYRTGRRIHRAAAANTLEEIRRLSLTVVPVSDDLVLAAADFKVEYAISYADAFAAALADRVGATLVSGDRDFDQLEGRIEIEKLRRH
jgi:predicted nucleic acid-binding protein